MIVLAGLRMFWNMIKDILKVLGIIRISIIMVLFSFISFFFVGQIRDAIIALGNFGSLHHFVIFSVISIIWALLVWYWARVFYIMEYFDDEVKKRDCFIIKHVPRLLGGITLLLVGISFLRESFIIPDGQRGKTSLQYIGVLFIFYTIAFLFFVFFRRKIFRLKLQDVCIGNPSLYQFEPFSKLPITERIILLSSTAISVLLLFIFVISPYRSTSYIGDSASILISCFVIWLPILYWIFYLSRRLRIPVFLIIFIIIVIFSMFNSNKDVRLTEEKAERKYTVDQYFNEWYKFRSKEYNKSSRVPVIVVLSEGGGIRAAYWSAGLLSMIQEEYPDFSKYVFSINGVSGGSFGATIFNCLLKYYKDNPDKYSKGILQQKVGMIVGKDYLSPVLSSMLTREFLNFAIPFPVSSFDHAKVFERTWELQWEKAMSYQDGGNIINDETFGRSFTSIWKNDYDFSIPALFINMTRVEDGTPITASNIKFDYIDKNKSKLNLIEDFYYYSSERDIRVSTASLLSARFPYVGPAGILKKNNETAGFVDGGYFDNTGANTAYEVFTRIKVRFDNQQKDNEEKIGLLFKEKIKPVVIYIKNGTETADKNNSGKTILYQFSAPLDTIFRTRDAHTRNALTRLKGFIESYDGIFKVYSLEENRNKKEADIPLGWALSKTVQEEIDARVKEIARNDLEIFKRLLP